MDFFEICKVYVGKMIIKAAKWIFNSDEICRSYSDLNFGVTLFGTQCIKQKVFTFIKLNRPKLVSMCGYILAINWQNFT